MTDPVSGCVLGTLIMFASRACKHVLPANGILRFHYHRTEDGKAFGKLNILGEYSRECLTIRVKRRLNANEVIVCAKKGILLQIHSNKHFPDVHECILRHGMRSTELLYKRGVLGQHVILHHTTLLAEPEIEMIGETDTATSYNPLASVWKGNAVAPALRMAQRGVRFGIGSDTTSADRFKNLMAAEACQRIEHALHVADFSCGAAWTWADAATTQGACATGATGDHGSLKTDMATALEIFVSKRRDRCSALKLLRQLLSKLGSYRAALRELNLLDRHGTCQYKNNQSEKFALTFPM